MSERKIKAGVTLMQEFCRPNSSKFKNYIDYIDREEAQRNNAYNTYNILDDYEQYNEYMGNPEKSTGLFTAGKDVLSYKEKKELKKVFETAQKNGSLMWQTVISFDNAWLEKNGIYDATEKILDEHKIKAATRIAVARLLKSEGMEHAVWSAGIHYNTDNIHVHIATVEPYPMREEMLYKGRLEIRGKFKQSNINKAKSAVVNDLMQTKEINQQINQIIRKDIVEQIKKQELANDPMMKKLFLNLCNDLPQLPGNLMNYNNRTMAQYRSRIDEISRLFLKKYIPEKYEELVEILDTQSKMYEEAYGGRNFGYYKEDKLHDLMTRMGNAVLKNARQYILNLEGKEIDLPEDLEKAASETLHLKSADLSSVAQNEIEDEEIPLPEINMEMPADPESFSLKLSVEEKEIPEELKEELKWAESFFELEKQNVSKEEKADNHPGIYGDYFKSFKELKTELTQSMLNGEQNREEILAKIQFEAEQGRNPFVKYLLGEMYLYGQAVEVSQEKSQKYFEDALAVFECDVGTIPEEEGKFSFNQYLCYRIGKQYDRGLGVETDEELAAEWFLKSDTDYAKYSLGKMYLEGRGVEQDQERAFQMFQSCKSNPFANLECAKMYRKGIGVGQDEVASKRYYENAFRQFVSAEIGQPDALFEYQIGRMLYAGEGCEQDKEKAVGYLKEAVKQKNIPSILLLSNIYVEERITEGMSELIDRLDELSIKGDNENAQYTLGKIHTADWKFRDMEKGVREYEKAAEKGNPFAQYQLGKLYTDKGLEIYDLEKGIKYLKLSAEQENEFAQYRLGVIYTDPEQTVYDLQKGITYLEMSAGQGNEAAKYRLGKLYLNPSTEIYDIRKGIGYLEELSGKGNQNAKYVLGKEYLREESEVYDPEKGIRYMQELAEDGNEYAQVKLGLEYIKGENVPKNLFMAKEYFQQAAEQGNSFAASMVNDLTVKTLSPAIRRRRYDPLGELDKAMIALRRSFYEAQRETRKNLLIYEQSLENEMETRVL